MTPTKRRVLAAIAMSDFPPPSLQEMATVLGVSRSTTHTHINDLVAAGFATRRNRSGRTTRLTAAGRAVLEGYRE